MLIKFSRGRHSLLGHGLMATKLRSYIYSMSMYLLAVYTGKQFKHKGHIPEHIRNQTVPIVVGNGLNFLSNNEQHGLLGIPTTGETYGKNT